MRTSVVSVLLGLGLCGSAAGQEATGGPLSAIDWLSQSVATPTGSGGVVVGIDDGLNVAIAYRAATCAEVARVRLP